MKKIRKTLTHSTITAARVIVDNGKVRGEDILETATTFETVTDKNAVRLFLANITNGKIYKSEDIRITSIERENITFEMSVEDFIRNATVIDTATADDFRSYE